MRYTTTIILQEKGDLNWGAASDAISSIPAEVLLDEDVARLWEEILPSSYVPGQHSDEVAEEMKQVLREDLERLRKFSVGDPVPYMSKVSGKWVCFGFEDPLDAEESQAACHAIARLDEVGVLEKLGLQIVA